MLETIRSNIDSTFSDFQAPAPKESVVIDHSAFPDLIDLILKQPDTWIPLRATSKAFKDRIDKLLYRHIIVTPYVEVATPMSLLHAPGAVPALPSVAPVSSSEATQDRHCTHSHGDPHASHRFVITSPVGRLPAFPPRSYTVWGSWTRSPDRDACAGLLAHTKVLELSAGSRGLEWLGSVLGPLDALRLRHDAATDAALRLRTTAKSDSTTPEQQPCSCSHCDLESDPDFDADCWDFRRFRAAKLVLLPPSTGSGSGLATMYTHVQARFARTVRKVVIHIVGSESPRRNALGSTSWLPNVETVYILNEAQKQGASEDSAADTSARPKPIATHLTAILLRLRIQKISSGGISTPIRLVTAPIPGDKPECKATMIERSWGRLLRSSNGSCAVLNDVSVLSGEEYAATLGSREIDVESIEVM